MDSDLRVDWIARNYAGEPVFETAVSALGAAWLFDSRIPPPVLPVRPPVRGPRKRAKTPAARTAEARIYEGR
jgi:hypothetical protein